jgi:hypothetical protein
VDASAETARIGSARSGHGGLDDARELGRTVEYEFMPSGDALVVATLDDAGVASAGLVVAVPGARELWQFRDPAPLLIQTNTA